jgi:hypothetical protein
VDVLGRPLTLEEHLANIERVTVRDIAEYLEQFPITGEGMLVSVGPRDWPSA